MRSWCRRGHGEHFGSASRSTSSSASPTQQVGVFTLRARTFFLGLDLHGDFGTPPMRCRPYETRPKAAVPRSSCIKPRALNCRRELGAGDLGRPGRRSCRQVRRVLRWRPDRPLAAAVPRWRSRPTPHRALLARWPRGGVAGYRASPARRGADDPRDADLLLSRP